MQITVIESVPVHEDIKLGRSTRERYIANYIETLRNLSAAGIKVVCYNFMPVFDWMRTDLYTVNDDGSTSLDFNAETLAILDPLNDNVSLPGWDSSYNKAELRTLFAEYNELSHEGLWENLTYFLEKIIPTAIEEDMLMAIHPDDPPWDIFGLPRIICTQEDLKRVTKIVDHKANGLCLCSGSLGAGRNNNYLEMLEYFCQKDRVNFVHARNIRNYDENSFIETAHPTSYGEIDMRALVEILVKNQYKGAIRPDHGRMIWGETGKPGYGLYDRALGHAYLCGLWEAIYHQEQK